MCLLETVIMTFVLKKKNEIPMCLGLGQWGRVKTWSVN